MTGRATRGSIYAAWERRCTSPRKLNQPGTGRERLLPAHQRPSPSSPGPTGRGPAAGRAGPPPTGPASAPARRPCRLGGAAAGARRRSPRRAPRAASPAAAARTRRAAEAPPRVTSSVSSVAVASVRERVTVVKSSRRTLIEIVRPRRPWRLQARAQLPGHPRQRRAELARGRRCRGRRCARATPRRPSAGRPTTPSDSNRARRRSSRPMPRPEARRRAGSSGASASAPSVVRPSGVEALGGLRADPGTRPGGEPREARAGLLAGQRHQPGRLLGVGGDLRDELVRPDPDRAGQPRGGLDLGHQPAHRGARREQPLEVEVGLVEADHLHALHVLADDRHDPRGGLAVERRSRAPGRRPGAQPPGARGRHRRADPEAAGLVAGGRDHRPRPRARHDDRPAPQLGMAQQLDRHVEGVGVEVGDPQGAVGCAHGGPESSAARGGADTAWRSRIGCCDRAPMDLTFSPQGDGFPRRAALLAGGQPARPGAAWTAARTPRTLAQELAAAPVRRRLGGPGVARRVRRTRRHADRIGDLLRRDRPRPRAAGREHARDPAGRPDADGVGHRRAEGALPAPDPLGRGDLVPGLLRARRRAPTSRR